MLTPRENYLAVLNHEPADYVPDVMQDAVLLGGTMETFENGPIGGGYDDFGLNWICTESANGQAVPDPSCHPVPDILEWKDYLKFPDLDKYDWEGMAAAQLANADRDQKVVIYGTWNSVFLRFSHMLGFEDALCAMYEEPEACFDMMNAIADYKCRLIDYIYKYFKPDIITHFDDVCTENGPFMSPAAYRSMIKPLHKKINDAIRSYGILPSIHCCGKCEELVPDFIDEGAVSWESAQPTNDIVRIQKEYGDRITVVGGYDTNGAPGRLGVTDEEIKAEVTRMMDTYAPNGSFISMGFLLTNNPDPMDFVKNTMRITGYVNELRYNYYKK
ncbi:MAG: uroporphyrinogen decarboxylase family protein [Blautia sp.]